MIASTLRMREDLHRRLTKWAKEEGRSFNELAVDVLEREARRHEGLQALEEARRFRKEMRAKYGTMPDSTPEIRQLREERAERG